MVTRSQLAAGGGGMAARVTRQLQAQQAQATALAQTNAQQQYDAAVAEQQAQQQAQADALANQQRIAENERLTEAAEWEQAERMFAKGQPMATAKGSGVYSKLKKLEAGEQAKEYTDTMAAINQAGYTPAEMAGGISDYQFEQGDTRIEQLPQRLQDQIKFPEAPTTTPTPTTTPYGPVQQVQVGMDTQGNPVYGPAGSTPYQPPQWSQYLPPQRQTVTQRIMAGVSSLGSFGGSLSQTTPQVNDQGEGPKYYIQGGTIQSPYGVGGTGIYTPYTREEQASIDAANERGSAILGTVPIFLSGGYDWQKKVSLGYKGYYGADETEKARIDKLILQEKLGEPGDYPWATPKKRDDIDYFARAQEKSYKELYGTSPPAIIYKAAGDVGGWFVAAGEKVSTDVFKLPPMSEEDRQLGKEILGQLVLFQAFSPFFATGAAKTAEQKQIAKQLSKTKFDKLKKLLAKVEKDLLNKKSRAEQLKYLAKYKADNKVGDEGMRNLVKYLEDMEILKLQKITLGESSATNVLIDIRGVPQMKEAGKIGAVVSAIPKVRTKTKVKTEPLLDIPKPKQMVKIKQRQVSMLGLKTDQASKTKQAVKTKQALKTAQALKTKQATKQKQIQRQEARQVSRLFFGTPQVLTQRQTQRQKLRGGFGLGGGVGTRPGRKLKKIPFFLPGFETPSKKKSKKEKGFELFTPEVRRFGEFDPISKPLPFEKALALGKGEVKRTLGASLRVTQRGKVIPLTPTPFFRKAKSEPGVLVQRRRLRLSSPTERKEIQMARGAVW